MKAEEYSIAALQEPHIDFLGRTRANPHWTVIYPKQHLEKLNNTRSIILINRNINSNNWMEIPFTTPDVTGVRLHGEFRTICIINIYNNCQHNESLEAVKEYMRKRAREKTEEENKRYIWLGDFNHHHLLWDEERNTHLFTRPAMEATQPLLNMITRYNMKMALPKDIPTLEACTTKNYTQVDNVFCLASLLDAFITCNTDPQQRPQKTDHMPIISQLEIETRRTNFEAKHNFKLTDWEKFRKTMEAKLREIPEPEEIETEEQFHTTLEKLDTRIKETIEKHVPWSKPSPYSKRWWTHELGTLKKEKERLARKSYRSQALNQDPVHKEYRRSRNRYSQRMRDTKMEHWAEWLETINEEGIWAVNRLVTGPASDGGRSRMPTLQIRDSVTKAVIREATNEEKGELLYQAFFPPQTALQSQHTENHTHKKSGSTNQSPMNRSTGQQRK